MWLTKRGDKSVALEFRRRCFTVKSQTVSLVSTYWDLTGEGDSTPPLSLIMSHKTITSREPGRGESRITAPDEWQSAELGGEEDEGGGMKGRSFHHRHDNTTRLWWKLITKKLHWKLNDLFAICGLKKEEAASILNGFAAEIRPPACLHRNNVH